MKKRYFDGLPMLAAVVLMCVLLTACVQPPVGGQTGDTPPPTEDTAPIESIAPVESAAPVEISEEPDNSIAAEDLTLSEDGHLASDSANAMNLQAALDSYFAARSAAINEPNTVEPSSVDSEDSISSAAIARANAIRDFWEDEGVYIVSEETSFEIREISAGELPGTVELTIYEVSCMGYNGDGADAPETDRFGSGIDHDMTVSMNSDGTFIITRDSYEETGYSSPDYDGVKGSRW